MVQEQVAYRDDSAFSDRRLSVRWQVDVEARATQAGQKRLWVMLQDISEGGFCIKCMDPLNVGDRVMIHLSGMEPLPANVVWARGTEYGCKFERALYPAVCDHLVTRLKGRG